MPVEPGEFKVTTTAQVERDYIVRATDEEHARRRLRAFLADPELLAEGIVREQVEDVRNTTPPKINSIKRVGKPKAVKDEPVEKAS